MSVDRFAAVELRIEKEQPAVADLNELFEDWGLTNSSQERLWVVSYDSIENIRTVTEVYVGGYHEVSVPIPPMLTAVLLAGTDRFLVAHNHPSGDTSPTYHDVDMIHTIMEAANTAGLYFDDALIVGPNAETFSALAAGLILPAEDVTNAAAVIGHARVPFTR